nr:hypothetical protein [Angustibacter aerolatus]
MLKIAARLPKARERVADHLALDGMPRERALATAFRLLDLGFFRVGGESLRRDQRRLRAGHPGAAARLDRRQHDRLRLHREVGQGARHRPRRPRGARRRGDPAAPARRRRRACWPTARDAAGSTSPATTSTST